MLSWMMLGLNSFISASQTIQANSLLQPRESNTLLCQARLDVSDSEIVDLIRALNCRLRERILFAYVRVFVVEVPDGQEQSISSHLKRSGCFEIVQANYFLSKQSMNLTAGTDSNYSMNSQDQSFRQSMRVASAHKVATGKGVKIAVIDTGVANIPPLRTTVKARLDSYRSCGLAMDVLRQNDLVDHGTSVASLLAANQPRPLVEREGSAFPSGVAPNCEICSIDATDRVGIATDLSLIKAILAAQDMGAKIVHIGFNAPSPFSLSSAFAHPIFAQLADHFFSGGGLIFVPSGNFSKLGRRSLLFEERSNSVIVVGGLGKDAELADYSAAGNSITFTAPSEGICTISRAGFAVSRYGTSYASAVVAGLAALAWSAGPTLSNEEILKILIMSTVKHGPDELTGFGTPDALRSVNLAKASFNFTMAATRDLPKFNSRGLLPA